MTPELSVIVPVLNEIENLHSCLDALDNQTVPRHHYEVIVVDNGSYDGSFEAAKLRGKTHVLREPVPDVYLARNRGIEAARGEIIAFTDSHCIADRDWLHLIREAFHAAEADLVVGRLGCRPDASRLLQLYTDYYDAKTAFIFDSRVTACYFGHCGNMALRRAAFDEIGLFKPLPIAGDTEIIHRLLRFRPESRIRYLPGARVQRQSVRTLLDMLPKLRRYGAYTQAISSTGKFRPLSLSERTKVFAVCVKRNDYTFGATLALSWVLVVGLFAFDFGRSRQGLAALAGMVRRFRQAGESQRCPKQ